MTHDLLPGEGASTLKAELEAACKGWQRILRLKDWDIRIKIVRHHQVSNGTTGEADYSIQKQIACISIVEPADHSEDELVTEPPELVLIHELLHLHFSPFYHPPEGSAEYMAHELALSRTALALYTLKGATLAV